LIGGLGGENRGGVLVYIMGGVGVGGGIEAFPEWWFPIMLYGVLQRVINLREYSKKRDTKFSPVLQTVYFNKIPSSLNPLPSYS